MIYLFDAVKLILAFNEVELQKYAPCIDKYTQCKMWKDQNLCLMSNYKEYMMMTCPISCSYCKAESTEGLNPVIQPVTPSNQMQDFKTILPITEEPINAPTLNVAQLSIQNKSSENVPVEKPSQQYVTALPQAMKLIQSLTQMISQTSAKKTARLSSSDYTSPRTRGLSKSGKKNENNHKKGSPSTSVSRRENVDYYEEEEPQIDTKDNTLRMIIQNRKRSEVLHAKKHINSKKTKKLKVKSILRNKKVNPKKKQMDATPATESDSDASSNDITSTINTTPILENEITDAENETPGDTEDQTDTDQGTTEENQQQLTTKATVDSISTVEPTTTISAAPCQQDDCGLKYSLILTQQYVSDYIDGHSPKFNMLKGNLVQDITQVLGSDIAVSDVNFEELSVGSGPKSFTKAYFIIHGDLSNMSELQKMVDQGKINGLMVKPNSLKRE